MRNRGVSSFRSIFPKLKQVSLLSLCSSLLRGHFSLMFPEQETASNAL
jgi:hypothetical protein